MAREPQMAAIVAGEDQGVHPYPLTPKTTSSTSWSLKGPRPPGNYWQRFATICRETFLGPPKPTTVPSGPTVTMETTKKVFGAGVEKTGATTSGGAQRPDASWDAGYSLPVSPSVRPSSWVEPPSASP